MRDTPAVRAWQTGQKIVFLIGLAVALAIVTRLALTPRPLNSDVAWFNYAPNSGIAFSPNFGRSPVVIAMAWLVATGVWTGVAVWLLGRPKD